MGIFKRLSFNWDNLADIVIAQIEKKEIELDGATKGIYYLSCAEICRNVDDILFFFATLKYDDSCFRIAIDSFHRLKRSESRKPTRQNA